VAGIQDGPQAARNDQRSGPQPDQEPTPSSGRRVLAGSLSVPIPCHIAVPAAPSIRQLDHGSASMILAGATASQNVRKAPVTV
jgi:hypothetical protein